MTARAPSRIRHQQGVVLFIALIVLVAMSLAGLALMRSVDTGTLLASNLAFKQGAINGGDQGIEEARAWLMANSSGETLYNDVQSEGYVSNMQAAIDLLGNDPSKPDFDWSADAKDLGTDAGGNRVQYVIHRMCKDPGAVATNNCIRAAEAGGTTFKKGGVDYSKYGIEGKGTVYYRVTVKVTGPRNTVAYVQATMY